jgi:hypothetical protein
MSSLTDILTAAKNIVTAINGLGQTYLKVQGVNRSTTITANTLVSSGQGRLASVSVIASSGSIDGHVYDSNVLGSLTNELAIIDHTLGVRVMNLPYNNGLVVAPGSGMTVVVTYSEG